MSSRDRKQQREEEEEEDGHSAGNFKHLKGLGLTTPELGALLHQPEFSAR